MDDSSNRRAVPGIDNIVSGDMRDALILTTKLIALIIVVTILSFGLVGCLALFVWLSFKYPQSATDILSVLVPAGISTLILHYGRKALLLLTSKNDTKLIDKNQK